MTNQVLLLTLLSSNFQNATLFMTTKNGEKSIPSPRRMALGSTHSSRDRSPGRIQLFASPRNTGLEIGQESEAKDNNDFKWDPVCLAG